MKPIVTATSKVGIALGIVDSRRWGRVSLGGLREWKRDGLPSLTPFSDQEDSWVRTGEGRESGKFTHYPGPVLQAGVGLQRLHRAHDDVVSAKAFFLASTENGARNQLGVLIFASLNLGTISNEVPKNEIYSQMLTEIHGVCN